MGSLSLFKGWGCTAVNGVMTECLLCCAVLACSVLQGLRRHYGTFTTVTGDCLDIREGRLLGVSVAGNIY